MTDHSSGDSRDRSTGPSQDVGGNEWRYVRDGDAVRSIPAGLSVFRIGDDGKLTFVRKYDIDVGGTAMFWMGMVQL